MYIQTITHLLGNTDIYLIDQIMKGRYAPTDLILDAGAGTGRNLHWFVQQGFTVYGTDRDPEAVAALGKNYPDVPHGRFLVATVESLPYTDGFFDHIISSAVLHFAENEQHFERMFGEMVRVLRPGGTLFIRMTTDIGLVDHVTSLGDGCFQLPDGSIRYLLTKPALLNLTHHHQLDHLEPFKTVVVDGLRSMAVLVLKKLI